MSETALLEDLDTARLLADSMAKDWFVFCEAIGVDADTHEAVADKVKRRVRELEDAIAQIVAANADYLEHLNFPEAEADLLTLAINEAKSLLPLPDLTPSQTYEATR